MNWSGRRESLILLLMSLQSSDHNHSIPLSPWYLNWTTNCKTEIQLLYYLTKSLNLKNKKKNLKLIFGPFFSEKYNIYRRKPNGGGRTKIGGANAPPIKSNKPRKRGFDRVSAAWVWPGGHTRGGTPPCFVVWLYLLLVFPFQLQDLTKRSLIVGFNHLI